MEEAFQETRKGVIPAGRLGGIAGPGIRGEVWSSGDEWHGVKGLMLCGK